MSAIEGAPDEVLARVQAIFDEVTPGARCQLQDYDHKIGCGADGAGENVEEVVFVRSGVTEEQARHHAEVLKRKVASGGSTAGRSS